MIRTVCVILFAGNYQPVFIFTNRHRYSLANKMLWGTNRKRLIWWARLDLNQQCHTDRIYSPARYQLRSTDPYLSISIIHADLRPTSIIFVFIQSVRRRSLSFGERPLTSGPSLSTKSHAGMITYNFHPPFRIDPNSLISINPIKN